MAKVDGLADHTKRLCDAHEAENASRKEVENAKKEAGALRATVLGKLATGAWSVFKTPVATLLMACAAWMILNYLGVPVPGVMQ